METKEQSIREKYSHLGRFLTRQEARLVMGRVSYPTLVWACCTLSNGWWDPSTCLVSSTPCEDPPWICPTGHIPTCVNPMGGGSGANCPFTPCPPGTACIEEKYDDENHPYPWPFKGNFFCR